MTEQERDLALLSALSKNDCAALDELVQELIDNELPTVTTNVLYAAADAFEDQSLIMPPAEAFSGRLIAAALRQRAEQLRPLGGRAF
jgi:hypothetical protein